MPMMRYLTDEEEKWLSGMGGRAMDAERRPEAGTDCRFCFRIQFRDMEELTLIVAVMNESHNGKLYSWIESERKRVTKMEEAWTLQDAVTLAFKAYARAELEARKYQGF
ncbi:MAG: hypothetical protein J6Y62_07175 [Clostridia bacterium]|nr:hypothetical protein [Clostridia bacterium]